MVPSIRRFTLLLLLHVLVGGSHLHLLVDQGEVGLVDRVDQELRSVCQQVDSLHQLKLLFILLSVLLLLLLLFLRHLQSGYKIPFFFL